MNTQAFAESRIPVDLFNPGQVFACLGLMEAAEQLLGGVRAGFDWREPRHPQFHLLANGSDPPVEHVLAFLDRSRARGLVPSGSKVLGDWKPAWGEAPLVATPGAGYPMPEPKSPATIACVLSDGQRQLVIDHWGDDSGRDNVKFWAGSGGYPGVSLARDALELVASAGGAAAAATNPFALAAPQSSSFRFDWRRDYVPIDAGFSLNAHGDIDTLGYPLVELLAAIGLSHARPARPDRRDKLFYRYAVAGRAPQDDPGLLPPTLLRAALGNASLPLPMRRFRMRLNWPGQEGQARSITTVTEESTP